MEDQPKFFELIEELEKNGFKFEEVKPTTKTTARDRHIKRVSALVNLLNPLLVVPSQTGAPYIKFAIEDEMYRQQIQDWIMAETKRFYKL